MSIILEKINKEIIMAMKAKNGFRNTALKMIKCDLQNNVKEGTPRTELDVVGSYFKKLAKNLDLYKDEVALEKLNSELQIVKEFLPKELSTEELETLIDKHLSLNNFGQIMKAVKSEVDGVFDGKLVSALIKSKLES